MASASWPSIGICAYWRSVDFGAWTGYPVTLAPQGYVEGVRRAGGVPLLVPPIPELGDDPELALDRLDGLLLTGGEDVDPSVYGAEPHPATGPINEARDRAELALLRAALARDLPVLAVCRGMQLLNVAYGGDLVQHLEEGPHQPEPGRWGRHPVQASAGRLLELAGAEPQSVPSYHHQALGRLGEGLVATAEAPDGLVEAVEDPSRGFCLGVMWHPDEDVAGGLHLFRGLVEAARAYAAARITGDEGRHT
ncbi:MAG TPA: gamma-glutamyl-gamma-aminobutyrate hydrolase family protein [Gaiellaceae bacterium]|jgi:gamma-glutamyl-gamma-aminobutyrate hydrolase PuuD